MRFLSSIRVKKEQSNDVRKNSDDSVEAVMVESSEPSTSHESQIKQQNKEEQILINKKDLDQNVNQQTSFNPYNQSTNHSNNQQNDNRSKNSSINEKTSLFNEQERRESNSTKDENDENEETEKITHKSILKKLIKKFLISSIFLLSAYITGYFRLSFAWILICLVIYFICLAHKIRTKNRLIAARKLQDEEKFVKGVLVDLPNWVLFPDQVS